MLYKYQFFEKIDIFICSVFLYLIEPITMSIFKRISDGDVQKVEKYLKRGGDVNATIEAWKTTLLMHACRKNQKKIVELLIKYGCDIDKRDINKDTAFTYASTFSDIECLKTLIDNKCDINYCNDMGSRALCLVNKFNSSNDNNKIILLIGNCCDYDGLNINKDLIEKGLRIKWLKQGLIKYLIWYVKNNIKKFRSEDINDLVKDVRKYIPNEFL